MSFFRRIAGGQKAAIPHTAILNELVEKARKAQYQEDYPEALRLLDEARATIHKGEDNRAELDISFGQADVFMAMGRYEEAESLLQDLRKQCEIREMKAPLAYTLSSLGQLAQKQCLWDKAQNYYEAARAIGQSLRTTGAAGRAAAHLADLHLQEGNANYAVYLLEDALPKLDKSGDRELIAYFQGRLGLAYMQTGNREQGLRALMAGLDMAQRLQHRGQMRFLEILIGQGLVETGDYRRARSHYLAALSLNPEQLERGNLLCELSLCSRKIQDLASAKQEAEAALEIAQEHQDTSLLAKAKASLGLSMGEEGKSFIEEAVRAYESLKPDTVYVDILRRLGTPAHLEKVLALAPQLPLAAAQAQTDLALLYQKEKHLKDALEAWQNAAKLYHAANQGGHEARVQCEIAALYERMGDGRMALREYGHALELLSHLDDAVTRGIVLANVAAAYSEFGEIESAQDFFKEAIEIAQRGVNPAAEALRRGNYGRLLALSNRAKQALPLIQQARSISESLGLKAQSATILGNEGLALAMLGDYPAAEDAFGKAIEQLAEEKAWQAVVYLYWGNMQLEQGKEPIAHQRALELGEHQIPLIIEAKLALANWAIDEKRLDAAHAYLREIDSLTKRLMYKRLIALLYQTQSKLYAAEGKTEEAQAAWEEAKRLRSLMRMFPISADWL